MRFDTADLLAATTQATGDGDADARRRLNDTLFDAAADRLRRLPPERFESLEELRATAQAIADEAQAHGADGNWRVATTRPCRAKVSPALALRVSTSEFCTGRRWMWVTTKRAARVPSSGIQVFSRSTVQPT